MGLTNFPNGITSAGVPIYGSSGFPRTSGGSHFYVDSVNGSDSADGTSWATAKASIFGTNGGYAKLTTNMHDVLHVIGGATAYIETAVCTWAKDYTHLVAETNPIMSGGRARWTNTVTTATAGEWVISGTGCHFEGIHWQWGGSATATSLMGVQITGDRNSFVGCNFEGPTEAAMGAAAGQRMLVLTSVQDNWFYGCKFGQRTILATAATGALIEFAGTNCTDNGFIDCIFTMYNSNAGSAAISFVNNAMPDSGVCLIRGCSFHQMANQSITDPIRFATGAHGQVFVEYSSIAGLGTLVWGTSLVTTTWISSGATGAAPGGIGVVAT